MTSLSAKVIQAMQGITLATAESCTGGMIGQMLTDVPGSSAVFKGGIISYCNDVKEELLGVSRNLLDEVGPVSASVAQEMARGARTALHTDVAVSVTGLAGPGGDDFGNPVGTVFIGYSDETCCISRKYEFQGDRAQIRQQAASCALMLILEHNS